MCDAELARESPPEVQGNLDKKKLAARSKVKKKSKQNLNFT